MRNTDLQTRAVPRHNDPKAREASQRREALSKLQQEEQEARQEAELMRLHRKRQRRIWFGKFKAVMGKLGVVGLILAAAALVAFIVIWFKPKTLVSNWFDSGSSTSRGAPAVAADFTPALPQNLKQPPITSENNHSKIVTYTDSINGANLTVSQQKLPDSFKSDPGAIAKLDQFKSADTLTTPQGKLYVATNITGQQWAAIALGDALVFINSSKTLDPTSWQKYISSL